ncbi:MAG TPA: zf-HC2 domain-containing protein [Desulfobulbaceae bacterium]|nr:zf-HC2 domain-containing protein [Desulfobulbaceae bacterium]
MRHWIFSCKQITELISESMDRKLPIYRRIGIRIHLMMCYLCRRYKKQLLFLRTVLQAIEEADEKNGEVLSQEARRRIKNKLDQEKK